MTLFIHLGAHKTATTYLQNVLKHNEQALAQRGLGRLKLRARHLFWHLYRDGDRQAYVKRRRSLARKFQRHVQEWPNGVLSSETLFGTSDLAGVDKLYPLAEKPLKMLAALTEGVDRKVVFYVRRQDDFIESSFINRFQTLATSIHLDHSALIADDSWKSFDHYLNSFEWSCLSWLNLVERMADIFGKENLIIRPFESIAKGKSAYAKEFLSPMVDTKDLDLDPSVYANRSFSAPALEEFLRLAPLQEYKNLKALRLRLQDEYPNTHFRRPSLLTQQQRDVLARLHKMDNDRLLQQYVAPSERVGEFAFEAADPA